jgi:hypothetical protein
MIPGYYTTAEIAARFGWQRQQVSATARREGWQRRMVGNAALWHAADVDEYAQARMRTELARELGWRPTSRGQGLIRHNDLDIVCPVCEGFAVEYSPDAQVQATGDPPWLCENGHGSPG